MNFTLLPKSVTQGLLSLALLGLSASSCLAADPSMNEVYKAAESGNFAQADAMMKQVLSDHPNSGKAHFVNAELLAKEGRLEAARDELQIAEKLSPGLSFAKPEALSGLKARLSAPPPAVAQNNNYVPSNERVASSSSSFLPWIIGFAALAFIFFVYRMFARPQQVYMPQPQYGGMGPTPMGGGMPMGQPYGPAPMGGGGGMGSGIMGGLVTGAAVGAGMVAGEALMHNVLGEHGNSNQGGFAPNNNSFQDNGYPTQSGGNYNMGGDNFGVQDSGSWDDSSGGGGGGSDDW
jgi:hypothetical protein